MFPVKSVDNARRSASPPIGPSSACGAYEYGVTAEADGAAGAGTEPEADTDTDIDTDREETEAPLSLPVLSGLVTFADPVIVVDEGELPLQLPSLSPCALFLYLEPEAGAYG